MKKTKKPKLRQVILSLHRGLPELVQRQRGITVVVRDYDVQEITEQTRKDGSGLYVEYEL